MPQYFLIPGRKIAARWRETRNSDRRTSLSLDFTYSVLRYPARLLDVTGQFLNP